MKKQEDLISVIVPVYKVEKYLHRCVDSIINQTYKNLEIILVDDGSPDNCPKICDEYAQKDQRIKVIHKKNAGISEARNAGLEIAQGEFVAFVDSDDYIDSTMYEKMLLLAQKEKNDLVLCGFKKVSEDGKIENFNEKIMQEEIDFTHGIPDYIFIDNTFGTVCRCLYNSSFLGGKPF